MLRKKQDGVEWLEFELLQNIPGLVHGVFLRHGGLSSGPYHSLNVSDYRNDDPANVQRNLEKICSILGLAALTQSDQVHGTKIMTASRDLIECDGLITQEQGLGLLINHADCQAAIFYDPVQKVIGNVHAGWRGNVQNIYGEMVETLQKKYNCKPENIRVCISPSLGPEAAEFINYKTELPESFWRFQIKPTYFDLWEISRWQLLERGILPQHIEIAAICTKSNPQDFFSYRREKESGRHATVVGWLK